MPLTVWSYFIASILGLLAFPPLTAAAVMLLFDRHFGTSFFLPSGLVVANKLLPNTGGSPLLWQHLFWFLGHPEVYVLILPALGIACDIIPAFTRKPVFGYRIVGLVPDRGRLPQHDRLGPSHVRERHEPVHAASTSRWSTLTITVPMTIFGVNMLASLWGAEAAAAHADAVRARRASRSSAAAASAGSSSATRPPTCSSTTPTSSSATST